MKLEGVRVLDLSVLDSLMAWTPHVRGPVFAKQPDPVPQHERSSGGAACNDGGLPAILRLKRAGVCS